MQLGIFSNVYQDATHAEVAARISEAGFSAVQLTLGRGAGPAEGLLLDQARAERIRRAYEDQGLRIAAISGYQNLVHPDHAVRRRKIEALKQMLRFARALGSPIVATETGTFNPLSDWDTDAYNHTEGAWRQFRDVIQELVEEAQRHDAVLALEAYVMNVVSSAERMARILDEVPSRHLAVVMDPTNYFYPQTLPDMAAVLEEIFALVGHRIVLAHAKDVRPGMGKCDLPAPGQGQLDYRHYLALLRQRGYDGALIIEHLGEAEVPAAKAYVERYL